MPEPTLPTSNASVHPRGDFFRHSGWLMISTVVGGALAYAVHFLGRKMSVADYGLFGALMAVTVCIPAMPLQMAFTHQTASAIAAARQRQLAGLVRVFCGGGLVLCAIFSLLVILFRREIMFRWEVTNPHALWILLPLVLFTLWLPVFSGMLQGQQNFLWLGWSSILSAGTRLAVAAFGVLLLGAGAAGMMSGVLAGTLIAVGIGLWQTRSLWTARPLASEWKTVLRETLPLLIGFGAFQFLFSADPIFAKAYFGADNVGFYTSAGTLSRALMWVVGPLALVMFPKIVHSHARSEKTDLMRIVLLGTAILAVLGAVALSLIGPWVVRFVYGAAFVKPATELLPWYAGAMVPLTLANVLLNNLLARGKYRIVPALCVLALLYVFGLSQFHSTLVHVLQVFGLSNLLLLLVCIWYSRAGTLSAASPARVAQV